MQTITQIKSLFFDRQKVIDAMDRATRNALSKAGAFIRTRARSSMRRRKKVSAPGEPPSAHEGSLKDKLYFSYDPSSRSVVAGPAKYKQGIIPNVLERGGTTQVKRRGVTRTVTIAARPYMGPALAAEAPNLPARWGGTLNG